MKTPTDVYNTIQLALAHVEDLKIYRSVTQVAAPLERVSGRRPEEVFSKSREALELLQEISLALKAGAVELPEQPPAVRPRDIYNCAAAAVRSLEGIKRRLGVPSLVEAERAALRISPSHVYAEVDLLCRELVLLRNAFC